MGLATLFEGEGKFQEAKEKYRLVLKQRPDLPAASNNLAWLIASEENGDLGEALRLAMQAKQSLPDQPHISDTLGWVHYKRNSYSLALSEFEQALDKRPGDPIILFHQALALNGLGENDKAIDALEKSLSSETEFQERAEAEDLLKTLKN